MISDTPLTMTKDSKNTEREKKKSYTYTHTYWMEVSGRIREKRLSNYESYEEGYRTGTKLTSINIFLFNLCHPNLFTDANTEQEITHTHTHTQNQ